MKTGLDLIALASKITADRELKHDFVASTDAMVMTVDDDGKTELAVADHGRFPIREIAHDQIGARLNIPSKYYDRMRAEAPDLLATNVNRWFAKHPETRMVRTHGGDARAFLSDRYQRIENEEIAEVVLPILMADPSLRVTSCEVTERRLYIQAVSNKVEGEVKRGDVVQAGVAISNSEVGHGSFKVSPLVFRLVCLNGLILPDQAFKQHHVGRRIVDNEALWADDTRKADDRAILLKARDTVRGAIDAVKFAATVEKMAGLTGADITGDPAKAVEVLAKKIGATETERGSILTALIKGADLSAWGVVNAVTYQAHEAASYDRAVEFEALGGHLLDLPRSEWKAILEAA